MSSSADGGSSSQESSIWTPLAEKTHRQTVEACLKAIAVNIHKSIECLALMESAWAVRFEDSDRHGRLYC